MVLPPLSAEQAYGSGVAAVLRGLQGSVSHVAHGFARRFYDSLLQAGDTRAVLSLLTPEEFEHLQSRQTRHLAMLLEPTLDERAHRERARAVGRVHALVGVDMMWLIDAYNLYQQALHDTPGDVSRDDQHLLQRVLDRRLLLDLQAQSAGYQEVDSELSQALGDIQHVALSARSITDLYEGALKALCRLDGVLAANVGRLGLQGVFEAEAVDGPVGKRLVGSLRDGDAPTIRVADDAAGGDDTPTAQAWKSGRVTASNAYVLDPAMKPWRELGASLGLRSSVAIPLLDDAGQTFAIVNVYSRWPGFFSARGRRAFLQHVQQILGTAALRHVHGNVVPHALRRRYSELVAGRRMLMLYQPIVDLRTGALKKVEALGRLVDHDGELVAPGAFLETLGNRDLLRLFEFGVEQVCRDHRTWRAEGLRVSVSLNLPPEGVGNQAYQEALFRTLERTGTDTEAIELEILESQEFKEARNRDSFLEQLRILGIRLVQDDLGAAHSSLLRLDSMPFDEVKIDQGLVRRAARRNPQRAFGFIYYLTQLAHELGATVTVEGLENAGLIEAAAIMGADCGQGYGIARPMPAAQVPEWERANRLRVDPMKPCTPWGALAGYLLWDRELRALDAWPDLVEDFVRSPCRVQRFIDGHDPSNAHLRQLLDKNHAVALRGASGRMYRLTRRDVIEELAEQGRRALQGADA